jgi:hypothetical protein
MPTIITRGAASARGYGFGASKASGGTPFPNAYYQYSFGGSQNLFYVNAVLKFNQTPSPTNGGSGVSTSSQNIMSFGFYYGNYSPHMYDNELGTRKDASAYYGGWYQAPYVAICSKSIIIYTQGWLFGGSIWRSTDGGVTYTASSPFTGSVQAMYARGSTVLVSTYSGSNLYYYISTNSGASWTSSGISGLPSTTPNGNPQSFYLYANGKYNFWVYSAPSYSYAYYTSTNGLSWTFISNVTGISNTLNPGSGIWYYNGYYYATYAGNSYQNTSGFRSSDGYTFSTFGAKPSTSGFSYRSLTATTSGLVVGIGGYCCSCGYTNPEVWSASNFNPASSGCWTLVDTYYFPSVQTMSSVRGYNQDQG